MTTVVAQSMDALTKGASAKIFSPSVGRNKEPLLEKLIPKLNSLVGSDSEVLGLLEIATGSGEHASLLAQAVPKLEVLPVEPDSNMIESIKAWSVEDGAAESIEKNGSSVLPTLNIGIEELKADVIAQHSHGHGQYRAMLCVNMIHISPYKCTEQLFRAGQDILTTTGSQIYTYGPYRENGTMVASNEDFHKSLQERNSEWGIRDVEAVANTAELYGFHMTDKTNMPANNLLLTFTKV